MVDEGDAILPDHAEQIGDLLQARFGSASEEVSFLADLLRSRMNVVLYGPPGTGKTRAAMLLADDWERINGADSIYSATFHPSYAYEDFVEGYRPVDGKPGEYALQHGLLLVACDEAWKRVQAAGTDHAPTEVLLLIDEINRADVARVFGELITYIEPDKRGREFRLAQSPKQRRSIPPNLFLIGTMNTADKSISLLDVALRRRFAFVEFRPESGSFATASYWAEAIDGVPLGAVLDGLNERLRRESIEPERSIGQALLAVPAGAADPLGALRSRFRYDVQPLVEEYCYGDRNRAKRILGDFVDSGGAGQDLTDDEFRRLIASIAADAPGWPVEPVAEDTEPQREAGRPDVGPGPVDDAEAETEAGEPEA